MKNILSAVLFLCSITLFGQSTDQSAPKKSNPLPNSLFNLDVHGILGAPAVGIKGVIGSNNSGVLLGFQMGGIYGYYDDTLSDWIDVYNPFSLRLGYQRAAVAGLYWNVSADYCLSNNVYYSYELDPFGNYFWNQVERKRSGYRVNVGLGYTLSFLKSKRMYFNTEVVFSVLNKSRITSFPFQLISGIGFRIGTPASTSYEGVKEIRTVPMQP